MSSSFSVDAHQKSILKALSVLNDDGSQSPYSQSLAQAMLVYYPSKSIHLKSKRTIQKEQNLEMKSLHLNSRFNRPKSWKKTMSVKPIQNRDEIVQLSSIQSKNIVRKYEQHIGSEHLDKLMEKSLSKYLVQNPFDISSTESPYYTYARERTATNMMGGVVGQGTSLDEVMEKFRERIAFYSNRHLTKEVHPQFAAAANHDTLGSIENNFDSSVQMSAIGGEKQDNSLFCDMDGDVTHFSVNFETESAYDASSVTENNNNDTKREQIPTTEGYLKSTPMFPFESNLISPISGISYSKMRTLESALDAMPLCCSNDEGRARRMWIFSELSAVAVLSVLCAASKFLESVHIDQHKEKIPQGVVDDTSKCEFFEREVRRGGDLSTPFFEQCNDKSPSNELVIQSATYSLSYYEDHTSRCAFRQCYFRPLTQGCAKGNPFTVDSTRFEGNPFREFSRHSLVENESCSISSAGPEPIRGADTKIAEPPNNLNATESLPCLVDLSNEQLPSSESIDSIGNLNEVSSLKQSETIESPHTSSEKAATDILTLIIDRLFVGQEKVIVPTSSYSPVIGFHYNTLPAPPSENLGIKHSSAPTCKIEGEEITLPKLALIDTERSSRDDDAADSSHLNSGERTPVLEIACIPEIQVVQVRPTSLLEGTGGNGVIAYPVGLESTSNVKTNSKMCLKTTPENSQTEPASLPLSSLKDCHPFLNLVLCRCLEELALRSSMRAEAIALVFRVVLLRLGLMREEAEKLAIQVTSKAVIVAHKHWVLSLSSGVPNMHSPPIIGAREAASVHSSRSVSSGSFIPRLRGEKEILHSQNANLSSDPPLQERLVQLTTSGTSSSAGGDSPGVDTDVSKGIEIEDILNNTLIASPLPIRGSFEVSGLDGHRSSTSLEKSLETNEESSRNEEATPILDSLVMKITGESCDEENLVAQAIDPRPEHAGAGQNVPDSPATLLPNFINSTSFSSFSNILMTKRLVDDIPAILSDVCLGEDYHQTEPNLLGSYSTNLLYLTDSISKTITEKLRTVFRCQDEKAPNLKAIFRDSVPIKGGIVHTHYTPSESGGELIENSHISATDLLNKFLVNPSAAFPSEMQYRLEDPIFSDSPLNSDMTMLQDIVLCFTHESYLTTAWHLIDTEENDKLSYEYV